ncbi:unnamed protein product [Cuscuta campestris]|uniref:Reverse transcriptase/retrotransposon-derived protein RNase H-like domain-containing protein n=1 Tax=Cuscuta campestris TaxID=132261 RepID=A0A484LQQ5_9ASTE|nr:unnamed protein product [Cuscuta campestris]
MIQLLGEKLYLYLGVSPGAISSILLREEGDTQRPIYYVSRTLRDAELRYSVVEKTVLAVVNTVKKLNHYFQAHEVEVRSHQPLSIIIPNPTTSNRVIKWSVYLTQYQIEMNPRTAIKAQALADFMVECTMAPSEVFVPTWREEHYEAQENEETMTANLHFVEERRERAFLRAEIDRRQVKEYYDRKVRAREFRVGDLVLRKREASQPKEGGKFSKSYEGPYKVVAVLRPGTYKLSTLKAKDDVDQEVTSQTSCSSSYESIPTSESLFDKFKKMMEDFEEINLKHSSLIEENKLLSEENLKLTEGRKSQLDEITQLKTENKSLSEKVKPLNKELGILKSKEAVDKLLEATKQNGREGLGFDPSNSKRKGRTTFIPPKPTAKPNKQKGKEKEKPTEVPKKKLEAKCSLPTFYQSYLEMIAAQELSEFLHMEIRFKYENEVLKFYKNGKVKTVQSKKNPHRTIQIIKSTVGGAKVKIPQKKLKEKLHLPNTGSEIGRLPAKNLDWKTIGISGQIPSGPAKKSDLKNDYKLVLELVIAYLECGSGGHADDIIQERAFIINALLTKSKVNWAAHFFNSISKHLGKPKQKYLCQGLYLGYILESMGVASKGKKYNDRYWLYYLSSKGENRAGTSATTEESSLDNVLIMSLKKSVKRKQVVSPSPSAEAPQNLALLNLEKEEEEVSTQGELQRKKKRKITSPSTSGNTNPDELVEKESAQVDDAENQFWQLYYDWRAWKVGNSAEQLVGLDQQLKNEKIIKRCLGLPVNYCREQILDVDWIWQRNYEDLHLEHLVTSPVLEFEADDEDLAVNRPIFSKATKDQMALITEAQADMEATSEDFRVFLETSPAIETVLTKADQENAVSTPQEQNQETSEEELQQLIQSQVLEIHTTPCEISNQLELEIPEKSTGNLEESTAPEANEFQEEQAVEIQRSSAEAEKEAQIDGLETSETPAAIPEQNIGAEERDSLSRDISNFMLGETEEESEKTLRIDDEEAEQGDAESLPLQLFHRAPSSHQHASFRQEIEQMEARHNKLMEKSEEKHFSDLKEISKSVDKTLEIISLLSNSVSNTMEAYASDCHLQLKEVNKIREQIATVIVSLQKQMAFLEMDIRSALAVSSANQVVTQDYLKVIAENQKEAFRLVRHFGTYTGNRKIDVIVQHNSPSLIPQLPIEVKKGELTYIPSHLNMMELILEAQQGNPENSTQHLTDSGLDGSEVVGTIASHFSDDAQKKERYNNLRRIKEQCGIMQGIEGGKFLGYLVSRRGIEPNPEKVKAILDMEAPRSIKEVQCVTRKMAALGRFLSKSSEKSVPFFGTLKKVPKFQWMPECQMAFEELKKYLLTPQVLAKPVKGEKLYLYLGVSPGAISSILLREEGDTQRPIYYVSRTLRDAELRYSVVEKIVLAVVNTVKKLNHYFQAHEVEVRSHQPLSIIIPNPTASNRVIKWSVYLTQYQIEMNPRTAIKAQALADFMEERMRLYKEVALELLKILKGYELVQIPRVENTEADVLSKLSNDSPEHISKMADVGDLGSPSIHVQLISVITGDPDGWMAELTRYKKDGILSGGETAARLIKRRAPTYVIENGQLYKRSYNGTLLRCVDETREEQIMEEVHEGVCAAHQGPFSMARRRVLQGYFCRPW